MAVPDTSPTPATLPLPPPHKAPAGRVFISHSSQDKAKAFAIYHELTARGIPCWIAPDHIPPGSSYPEQLIEGVKTCHVLMVLLSAASVASKHVASEVELAAKHQKQIFPVLLEKVADLGGMEFFLTRIQQLPAYSGSIESHLVEIAEGVASLLSLPAAPKAPLRQSIWRKRRLIAGGVLIAMVLALFLMRGTIKDRLNADWPRVDRSPKLEMQYELENFEFRPMADSFAAPTIRAGSGKRVTQMLLKPRTPGKTTPYLLAIEKGGPVVIAWEPGGEHEMSQDQDGSWRWYPDAPRQCTLILLASPKELSEADRRALAADVTKLGTPPELGANQQLLWYDRRWKLFKDGAVDREGDFDGDWADALVELLNGRGIRFDGRTFPVVSVGF